MLRLPVSFGKQRWKARQMLAAFVLFFVIQFRLYIIYQLPKLLVGQVFHFGLIINCN